MPGALIFCIMVYSVKYDPSIDIREVESKDPAEYSVSMMLESGQVPANSSVTTASYNHIEDPSRIIGSVKDVFSALESGKMIQAQGKKSE